MLLLESGVSSDSSTLRLNQTALHISAFAGNSHCLKWLLHCGASINRQVKTIYITFRVLSTMFWTFQLACLRKLMTVTRIGVNCNIRTSRFKQTPAHLAAFQGHPQCLLWLLQYGAEINSEVSPVMSFKSNLILFHAAWIRLTETKKRMQL